jgi:hypothetical protein
VEYLLHLADAVHEGVRYAGMVAFRFNNWLHPRDDGHISRFTDHIHATPVTSSAVGCYISLARCVCSLDLN